jgi:hypothetical protein
MTGGNGHAVADAPDGGVRVVLTPPEMTLALLVGGFRQVTNLRDGRRDRYGASPERGWQCHIEGAAGELAVAKWLNLYWSGQLGRLWAPDVGRLEVRTRSRDDYELLVHPDDPAAAVFVLVVGRMPTFRLVGWIRGAEATRRGRWDDPAGGRPAYFVPQAALAPLATLRRGMAGAAPA